MKRLIPVLVAVAMTAVACSGGGGISAGDEGDTLTGVSVDPSVAAVAELHETSMSDDDSGTMMMQEVLSIEVPTSGEVSLEPGGFHVMLMQLAEPLETGAEFTVTLTFENAGDVDVNVEVRES